MNKKPEEIKKVLHCCLNDIPCEECPYNGQERCLRNALTDCHAYILTLEADKAKLQAQNAKLVMKTEQLQRKLDAAVSELPHHCWNCKYHRDEPIEETDDYGRTIHIYCDADCCFPDENSSWEWRGVPEKEENNG